MVRPYWFQYRARAKGHWVGQPLIRILTSHFHRHPPAYYLEAVETGRVKVNQQRAAPDQLFAATDLLHHDMHIHEPAVTSEPVQIIHSSNELVVVNKPAGLPCHEVSLYKYNTLSAILRLEMNVNAQSCVNRLDGPVSGVILFPRTFPEARKLHMAIMTGQVGKFYIARVRGKFPIDRVECAVPLVQAETGVSLVDYEKGRTAHTIFEHAGYDSATDTSLVKCNPTTGRRHQIRAHLNHLGFPIANDLLYGQGPLVRSRAEFLKLQQGSAEDWSQMSPEELTAFKESQPERFVKEDLRAQDLDMDCWNCRKGLLHSFRKADLAARASVPRRRLALHRAASFLGASVTTLSVPHLSCLPTTITTTHQ